uniref:Major facilitator superfamily (MFS) profile domain-containing protein n=1 Tax=Leersia perrieri TaxID=77586 RepID=A0A0D9WAH5_9ORYZ
MEEDLLLRDSAAVLPRDAEPISPTGCFNLHHNFARACKVLRGMVTIDAATLFALVASIGNLLQGWDNASIAGAIFYIKKEFDLESMPKIEGFIMAMALIGAAISTLLSGPYADKLGRRLMLLISSILAVASELLIIFLSQKVYMLIIVRFISGLSIGLAVTHVPLYISEIAPSEIRGKLNTFPQLSGSIGMFFSYCVVFGMSLVPKISWRTMIGIELIPSLIFTILIIFYLPESPRWLVSKGRVDEARIVLQRLQRSQDISGEMANILEGTSIGHTPTKEEFIICHSDKIIDGKVAPSEEQVKLYGLDEDLSCIAYKIDGENTYRSTMGSSNLNPIVSHGDSSFFNPNSIVRIGSSFFDPIVTLTESIHELDNICIENQGTTLWDEENQYALKDEEQNREEEEDEYDDGDDFNVGGEHMPNGLHIGGGWQVAWTHGKEEVLDGHMQRKTLSYLLEPGVRNALMLGIATQVLQQFAGINAILYYTPEILEQVGVGVFLSKLDLSPCSTSFLLSAITTLVMLPCIGIAVWLIVIKGRRHILLGTIPMLLISLIILVATYVFNMSTNLHAIISALCVIIYQCVFVVGFGPIPNILCAEIFPTRVRAICLVICSLTFWFCDTIVTYSFPLLMRTIGLAGVFGICAIDCALAFLFIYFKVPETKGIPLEVMSECYAFTNSSSKDGLEEDK